MSRIWKEKVQGHQLKPYEMASDGSVPGMLGGRPLLASSHLDD
jgi:hypothetical protein